jgi:hypothetical protein
MTETLLVFAGIPLAVAALLALLTLGTGPRRAPRYRPGRPFEFSPVWFVSTSSGGPATGSRDLPGPARSALAAAGEKAALETEDIRPATKKGGARGTW